MTAIEPRFHLPEAWAGQGACPVCQTRGQLSILRQGTEPDQLGCGACGAAFNVEAAGQRVRLVRLPPALAVQAPGLL
ncbi:MAG: hypothetical protein IT318_12410, partial [Anaerolineales bacterium]|nr:hypothetical protein [Anaerolineales bacterium]